MTSENTKGRIFGAVEVSEEDAGQDWRALERGELLEQAIVALNGAKMEAEEAGDGNYARHVDTVLFPFLETELEKVRGEVENMTEIRELMEVVGLTEEEARLRLRDEDLWLLRPEQRFDEDLQGEEGVRMWEEAAQAARAAANTVCNGPRTLQASPAITQLVWDAAERAEEALHRARKRAGNPEMRSTVFGEVLAELLEKREIPVTPFRVGKLAEEAGLDGWKVINRMASADAEYVGPLDGLAEALDLSEPEKDKLAAAYALERRADRARAGE